MLICWDIYEIRSHGNALHGVKLRGRIRKFTIENEVACLIENALDEENVVRFAVQTNTSPNLIIDFVKSLVPEVEVAESLKNIPNPVLSKIKVNDLSRYDI